MTLNIYQPDIINRMNKVFNGFMNFNTPATPNKGIVSNQETDTKISYHIHKRYRSSIGYILYLVKNSQPKSSNAVREISKFMDTANTSHYKALLRAIKYIIETKYYFC